MSHCTNSREYQSLPFYLPTVLPNVVLPRSYYVSGIAAWISSSTHVPRETLCSLLDQEHQKAFASLRLRQAYESILPPNH